MKKIIKIQFISIVIVSLFLSCSEEFLERKPLGEETTATFYTSADNALQAVTACYAVMIYRGSFSRNYWAFTDCGSDDTETAGEIGGNDQVPAQRIDRMVHFPTNAYFYEFWRNIYEGINNCNIVIEKLALPEADFNINLKNRLIAEAKCLRAIYYFYMNSLFGGVPLILESLTPDDYYSTTRASIAEVLHQVQADLEEVAGILPATYSSGDDGRVTSGAAKAYLLKALVFESSYAKNYPGDARFEGCEQKWDQAWDVAQQIIGSDRYILEPHYADIWTEAGDDSREHIFRVISAPLQVTGTELINTPLVSTVLNTYQSCRAYWEVTIDTVGGVPVRDSVAVDGGRNGWGLNAPTYNLAAEYEEGDPRFKLSITTDEDTLLIDFGANGIQPRRAAPSYASPTKMNNKKYDPPPSEWVINNFFRGPRDIKMFRFADVLLLAAEAALQPSVNQPDKALEYVNMIRTRARNSGITGQPLDLQSVDLSDVIHERRIELAMEAHRFLDIVRWGIAYDRLNGLYRATDTLGGKQGEPIQFIRGKHEFYPIPEQEIILSKGSIAQNPGY
jgi:hypothetical protein